MSETQEGAKRLELEYWALDEIAKAERNPKDHDIGYLGRSMRRWGFTTPVLIDERTGRLIAGHGRIDTCLFKRQAGEDPPEYVVIEDGVWKLPVIRGWSSKDDADAEGYLVADNRANELGGWDTVQLAEIAQDHAEIGDLEDLGFDYDDLAAFKRFAEDTSVAGHDPEDVAFRAYDEDQETKHRCPKCGFEFD